MKIELLLKRLVFRIKIHSSRFEASQLRWEMEEKQRNIQYLKYQLAKERADKLELEQKPSELRNIIADILREPDEQLRSAARFQVRKTEAGPSWEVVTGQCCLGGCDMDIYSFPSDRDALLFACLLEAVGYRPPHNVACPTCYAVYMKDSA